MAQGDITQKEIPVLTHPFNFTDGHVYRPLTPGEQLIIDRMPSIFRQTMDRSNMDYWADRYIDGFFELGKQSRTPWMNNYLFMDTASACIEAIANLFRKKFKGKEGEEHSVALITPTFDNIYHILKRHDMALEPIPDTWLSNDAEFKNIYNIKSSVIFLCLPNNPTGATISQENFTALLSFCRDSKKTLVIDNCFRFYLPPEMIYDQYALIAQQQADVIMIEDTGKTWPSNDNKVSFLTFPGDKAKAGSLASELYGIYTDMYLFVSPFKLALLDEFVRHSNNDQLASIKTPVAENRATLHAALNPLGLYERSAEFMSVAWVDTGAKPADALVQHAREAGVHILSGRPFFWENPNQGNHNLRFALTRDPNAYKEAMRRLSPALKLV